MTDRSPVVEPESEASARAQLRSATRPPPIPETAAAPPPVAAPVVAAPVVACPVIPVAKSAVADGSAAPSNNESDSNVAVSQEEARFRDWWGQVPSWMASMVAHLTLVLVLALLTTTDHFQRGFEGTDISADTASLPGSDEDLTSQSMEIAEGLDSVDLAPPTSPPELSDLPQAAPMNDLIGPLRSDLAMADVTPQLSGGGTNLENVVGVGAGGGEGNSLELRMSGANRAAMVRAGGGTKQSEAAVTSALKWLAEHQNYDGSWSFDHQKSPRCHGSCSDPGYIAGKVAATAMALLPFLGNGHTLHEGPYKKQIELGLRFLVRSQDSDGGMNEPGGTMYGHGLASIVLCEAFGMTREPFLQPAAQKAVNFIAAAQDPIGGGWRYMVQQPGDTSVVGWQVMALKSAQMAYLRVPQQTMRKAGYFLDQVQSDRGAVYGYQGPERGRPATTAIGLLCRMYMGWKHEQAPLQRGVQILSALGPSTDKTAIKNNMYYNYYATQVMHHFGGYPWQRWNEVMREYLISTQSKKGHEAGSWFFDVVTDHYTAAGGRLYCTSLAAMTLEVYYRYMPLYRGDSTKGVFGGE